MNKSNTQPPANFPSFSWPYAFAILFILTLLMFADVLFSDGIKILSSPHTDIASQFIYWRDFGFNELKKGNLALWNPHLFSGAPFLGGFQAALLYPLNFPYLIFPLGFAVNIGISLHVFLLGFFMYLWAQQRGLHPLAALLSGILIMFCGTHFLHIYAGHLPNLCAMTWVPLIFLALDGLMEKPSLGRILLGTFAFAMHILAGHPQYVYYTCITVLIYVTICTLCTPRPDTPTQSKDTNNKDHKITAFFSSILARKWSYIAIFIMFAAGAALSAVQILTGIDAAQESVRSGGVSFSFASMFSFPPENFLTLIAPYFFGDLINSPYWGRAYLWEMNIFISINALILAIYALMKGGRQTRCLAVVTLILVVLALGVHTPLFRILYDYFPGFNKFRGTSKFIFFASLFLVLLSGMGLDALLKSSETASVSGSIPKDNHPATLKKWLSVGEIYYFILGFTFLISGAALWLILIADGWLPPTGWRYFLQWIAASGESYLSAGLYAHGTFVSNTAFIASINLFVAALTLAITSWMWRLARTHRKIAVYGIFFFAFMEIFFFARITQTTFDLEITKIPALEKFLAATKNDARILNLWKPNSALSLHAFDIWGYDPGVPKRYAELIAFTQTGDPRKASQYVNFQNYHPLLKMLRLRYIITPGQGGLKIQEIPDVMSLVYLLPQWQVASSDEQILQEMGKSSFDPRKAVILEKLPGFMGTACSSPGSFRILSSATDDFTIEAKLACPAVLLITDNFSNGWHVEPINKNVQNQYEIIRANYTLMAIPLNRGDHLFRMVYKPISFTIGAIISIISCLLYGVLLGYWYRCQRKVPVT